MLSLDVRQDRTSADTARVRELSYLDIAIRRNWPELRRPIVLPWTEQPVVALDGCRPWLFAPVECDPHSETGRTVVPNAQRRQLVRLAKRDIPVQRIAIAHELDPLGPVSDLIPMLRTGPCTCSREVAKTLVGPPPAHPGVARTARLLDSILGATARGAAAGYNLLLDPIVFGVIAPNEPTDGEPALWFLLTAWRW
jgi:hypothetical protein